MKSKQRSFLFVLLSSLILCSCGPVSVSSAIVSSQNHQETSSAGKTSSSTQQTSSKEQTPSSSKTASSSSSSQASSSSSSVDPAVKMTAFMEAYGTYKNNQYQIVEDNNSGTSYLTRHLFYSPSHNNYVAMSDSGHFTSSSGQVVYFESDQTFTLGSYLTTTVIYGNLNIDSKMISFKYANLTFDTNGDLQTYTYTAPIDQYGATDTQKADFAKSVAVYSLDCYQWARKKYAAYGGSFVS